MSAQEHAFYRVSVKAWVQDNEGRILLARQSDGRWDLLGGGLDHGEEPHNGLKREIHEETGLTVTSIEDRPLYFLTVYNEKRNSYLANAIYKVTLENLNFIASEECQELRYFSLDDMKLLDLCPNVEELARILAV